MNQKEALKIIGGLSDPAKMPCQSWSIPAETCILGSLLRLRPGTTCEECYALKGSYRFPGTIKAMNRRYSILMDAIRSPIMRQRFVQAFSFLLNSKRENTLKRIESERSVRNDGRYFRWHDSGDLQNETHLDILCEIARTCPEVEFWLPTRETGIVNSYVRKNPLPANLLIRLSTPRVNQEPSGLMLLLAAIAPNNITASGVHTETPQNARACPAYENDGECGSCRACWDDTRTISYPLH